METNSEHKPQAEALTQQWKALVNFAAELTWQIAGMGRRGQRGFLKNVEILEAWVRGALLQLAEQIELPKLRGRVKSAEAVVSSHDNAARRRAGFRAIEPDEIEKQLVALKRPSFDITQFCHSGGPRGDARTRYLSRLEAIGAALANPELYARRVKRKLIAREKRPPMKQITFQNGNALPDLARLSPSSDLGRLLWYNDTS